MGRPAIPVVHYIMRNALTITLFSLSIMLMTACRKDEIRGSGITTTEYRSVGTFTNVRIEGPIRAHLRQSPVRQVAVRTDANVQSMVRTIVSDNTLILTLAPGNYGDGIRFEVTVDIPTVGRLTHNGVEEAQVSGFFGLANFEVVNNGVADIDLHGSTRNLSVTQHGVGRISAQGMSADTCLAGLSGVGSVEVRVNDLLHGYLSGVGSIYYHGSPVVDVTDTGVGNVIRVD